MENPNNNDQPIYKRPIDEYLPCEEYNGKEGFIKLFREDEKRYYFAFNAPSGETYLRSQGYQNEPGRDNGINSVIKNAQLDERWQIRYDEKENYHYYSLKAGNRQEIARSCRYGTKEEMEKDYAWVRGEESIIGTGANEVDGVRYSVDTLIAKEGPEIVYKKNVDDYLPCEEYKGDVGFTKFTKEKEFYFGFNGEDGNTYLRSEVYANEHGRDNGIDSVIRNAPKNERWNTGYEYEKKYHYYSLKAGNGQEIARSCEYDSKERMLAGLANVKGEKSLIGVGSKLIEGTLKSAAMLASESVPPIGVEDKKGCGRWWPWLLLLALLIILCIFFWRGCDETEKIVNAPKAVIEKVEESATTVKDVVDKTVQSAEGAVSGVVEGADNVVSETTNKLEASLTSGDSFVIEDLNFVYGSNNLTPESQTNLQNVIDVLKKHTDILIEIQGHTNDVGNDEFNKILSPKRVKSIKSYLVKGGISATRLEAVGYGEKHPIASNLTDEGRAKKRRIEFKVLN